MSTLLQSHHLTQQGSWLRHVGHAPSRCVVAAAAKKQKPKKRKPKQPVSQRISYLEDDFDDEFEEGVGPADIRLVPGTRVPKAPAPKAAPLDAAPEPEDLYPVFPKQPKSVERLPGSKWSWDDDATDTSASAQQQQPPARLWNPRTGFMRTRAEVEQEQAAAAAAAAGSSGTQAPAQEPSQPVASTSSSSSNSSSSSRLVEPLPAVSNPLQPPRLPPSALEDAAAVQSAPGQLPAVGRGQVLTSCAATAIAMTAAAVGISLLAAKQSAALFGTSQETIDQLLQVPLGLRSGEEAATMLSAACAVTAARFGLKQWWPEFREATDRSNQQVLSSLGWPDMMLVAILSGVSEEALFRWALISATWPDARGVLLSGAVFGVLHISGGRNVAFAVWATAVGWLYGAAFLVSGNLWVPAGAHALANFASAALWKAQAKDSSHNSSI